MMKDGIEVISIGTTIGSKDVYETGEVRYYSGATDAGWCFKDNNAWNGRGICYIPEEDFRKQDYVVEKRHTGYTREDIENIVRETLEDLELPFSEDFVIQKARSVFDIAKWEFIGTIVDRIDWEEELNEFNMKEN